MTFIVPGVCRYAVKQTYEGRNVANVIDMEIDTTGSTMLRAEAVEAQAGVILNSWDNDIRVRQVDDLTCVSVDWVDLDDVDGTTGSRSVTDDNTWPANGGLTDPPEPGGLSLLVHKVLSGSSRARRNGRLYMCGLSNSHVDTANANLVAAAYLADFEDQWDSFFGDVNQTEFDPTGYSSQMCVVHILTRDEPTRPGVPGTPLTGNHTNVAFLTVDAAFAYQRRRAGR